MLEKLTLWKTEFNFLCSDAENCDECGDYVRHVFSFVLGSLAAISLLVVFCSMIQKPFAKKVVRFVIMIILKLSLLLLLLLLLLFYFLKEMYYYTSVIWSEKEGDYNQSLN